MLGGWHGSWFRTDDASVCSVSRAMGSRCGTTLVEVMVASALLLLFVIAAVGVLVRTAAAAELVRRRAAAATLALSWVERARHMDFERIDDLVEADPGVLVDQNGVTDIDGIFRRRCGVTTVTNGLPMKQIRVDVWPRDRRTGVFHAQPETVETVIAKIERVGE